MSRTRKPKRVSNTQKKKCNTCLKERAHSYFFKVDSPLFPDGMINTCRDCIRKTIDVDDIEQVISFLRQIDKPFYQDEWDKALSTRESKHPIGAYLGKINSLQQYKGKTFANSDGINKIGSKVDLTSAKEPDVVTNVKGEVIKYSDELVNKWGVGYTKHEYLQMEKFFQDMKATHDIHTPTHIDMLTQLAYLSIDRNRLRKAGEWGDYTKVSKTYEDMMKSAGFRPVDRQSIDEKGIRSFSQIWEEVEKRGFRKPPPPVFDEDIVDAMMISLANYYHRLVGKQILTEIPEEIKKDMEEFYTDDLTPVDIDDEAYNDLDFSINEDEDDILLGDK